MNNIIKRVWNQNRMVNIEDLRGMAFQAEDGGHTFEISGINDANEAVSLSGTVAGVFMRPDGADVALTGTASDGVVSVTLSDACYAVAGRFGFYIFVTSDSKKTCVYACIGTVSQTSYGAVAGDTPQNVVDLINAINAAIASIPADYTDLMAAIAPTYSNTALYAVGAYAWYDGVLYRCKTAITTAEAWTAAHWTQVALANVISVLEKAYDIEAPVVTQNAYIRYDNGNIVSDNGYDYAKIPVYIFRGGTITGKTSATPNAVQGLAFYDDNDVYISGARSTNTGSYNFDYSLTVPTNAAYMLISIRKASADYFTVPTYPWSDVFDNLQDSFKNQDALEVDRKKTGNMIVPYLRDGTAPNAGNANAVTVKNILPIKSGYDYIRFRFEVDETLADEYGFAFVLFKNATDGMTTNQAISSSSVTKKYIDSSLADTREVPYRTIDLNEWKEYDHFTVSAYRKLNGSYVPIRIATDQYSVLVEYGIVSCGRESVLFDVCTKAENARHIANSSTKPLTLLHFSDLHADKLALARIMSDANKLYGKIDDAICTGDMVGNTAEQISSWWDGNVMTCMGNHDTASYSSGTGYNWTALSMADRAAYYIVPFESGWGITRSSGKSYYYKDYSTQKVRLIVMDGMLYTDNGADATAQTSWLSSLLADAITNSYHVIIAIHAPHGGAVAEDCSFSRYGQTAMPTWADCNTPQTVIDAVSSAITSGLKFVGYIVGHTHQDNVWDAENDNKQHMYCVTCAAVADANQWKNSDQNRNEMQDAYNLVTIDTANTLVKIVRGGGADIDDHMRTRKAICFNYSTGEKVGEIL